MPGQNIPLNNIRIASPCSVDWESMYGSDRKRFCGECKLNVYNLSGMTLAEAEDLLQSSEGRLCVRFYRRSDGTVLTKDCPVGWARVKRRVSRVAAAVATVLSAFVAGIFAFSLLNRSLDNEGVLFDPFKQVRPEPVVMGIMQQVDQTLETVPD